MKKCIIIFIKIFKRIFSIIKLFAWKILYLNSFKCGKKTYFYPRTHVIIDGNGIVEIGQNCFFNCNCSINSMSKIEIGDDCIFGENVCLYDHNHEYKKKDIPIRKQGFKKKNIIIGNNCWIGSNVIILSGVHIGNNVVIGAGTIVTKSIPDNSVIVSDNCMKFVNVKK